MNYQKFPFGKYKGYAIDEIPATYLVYALEEFSLPEELENEVKETLCNKLNLGKNEIIPNTSLKTVYRILSKKYHPDKGGNDLAMSAINDFYNHLINQ